MTLKEAIKEMKDQRDALALHHSRGGDFKPSLEAVEMAIDCMEADLRVPLCAKECVQVNCMECYKHGDRIDGTVCLLYADKVDEIRRTHEEE